MDKRYIAGFFDGEGSAMILTIRCRKKEGFVYRFRPIIKIAQKPTEVLYAIHSYLEYGHVDPASKGKVGQFIVNGLDGVIKFAQDIGPYCFIKKDALKIVAELAQFQMKSGNRFHNYPYSKKETIYMLNLRDRLFSLNAERKARIEQKYSRERILAETTFIDDLKTWHLQRVHHALASSKRPQKGRGRRVVKDVW